MLQIENPALFLKVNSFCSWCSFIYLRSFYWASVDQFVWYKFISSMSSFFLKKISICMLSLMCSLIVCWWITKRSTIWYVVCYWNSIHLNIIAMLNMLWKRWNFFDCISLFATESQQCCMLLNLSIIFLLLSLSIMFLLLSLSKPMCVAISFKCIAMWRYWM